MKTFLSITAAAAALFAASGAYAGTKAVQVTLPDESIHVTVTSKKGGAIAPSMSGMVHYHCASDTGRMKCTYIQGHTADGPSALGTVAAPAGFVAGMKALRPTRGDSTYVSNDSSSDSFAEGGRGEAVVDQSYEEDNSTRFDFWGNEGPVGIFPVLPPPPPPPAPEVGGKG